MNRLSLKTVVSALWSKFKKNQIGLSFELIAGHLIWMRTLGLEGFVSSGRCKQHEYGKDDMCFYV